MSLWLLRSSDWLCIFHLHFLILVADQVNSAVAPYAIEVELAVNVSTGGGGGATVIMTELEVDPP